jgi:hypothetical protein
MLFDLEAIHHNLTRSLWIFVGETSSCGFGIFAAKRFARDQKILVEESGDYYDGALSYEQIVALDLDLSKYCFQVGLDRFLLPTGSIDDLINHSCFPNAGIRLTTMGYELIALRDIEPGEEITYDYSTYIESPERLVCRCRAVCCRQLVGRFRDLPRALRAYYLERGVVGAFAAAQIPADSELTGEDVGA